MSLEVVWKYAKWIAIVTAAVAIWVVWIWFRAKPATVGEGERMTPPPPLPLMKAVEDAREEALKARVKASVESEAHQAALVEISKIDDGAERRKRLAAMLRKQ